MARRRVWSSKARWLAEWRRITPVDGTRIGFVGMGEFDKSVRTDSIIFSPMVSHGIETLESMG